jgi:hypothetical protein
MSQSVRRLLGFLLALTLVVGSAVQSVQSADMAAKMSTSSEMPMPGGCSGCGDDDNGMPMACSAICGSTITALIPVVPALEIADPPLPVLVFANIDTSQRSAPDPYPPRPSLN